MISISWVYGLAGLMFAAFAILSALDRSNRRRFGNAAFWGLVAASLLAGDLLGDFANGCLVLGLAGLATLNLIGRGEPATSEAERAEAGARYGNRLFLPILVVLLTAVLGTLIYLYTPIGRSGLLQPNRETFILLAAGVLLALAIAFAWLRPPLLAPLQEGRRLIDAVGWAAVLPLMLAALGVVLAQTGVGRTIGSLVVAVIPPDSLFLTVAAYGIGMALFTILTGNAFAAFPVLAVAIGIPLLIQGHGGDPAVIGAIGMLAGFCGTLMTPMAANFNLVPAALLELDDVYGVIKAQVATALPLLAVNILLIYFLAF
ncbi:DUF979 domain-containing protein [Sphingosinicella terrae]|uniref:DUF979 domain-containing protein n=1 Tax=Sphingosinicella terrae TaxID=2172047 RepID=UPI000E0DCC47|nr:DUF979 domain-containing protein [Sphingosinicella terrae]